MKDKNKNLFSARNETNSNIKSRDQQRVEVFCAGNKDLNSLATYINFKLVEFEQKFLTR